jgi:hypothetical protein
MVFEDSILTNGDVVRFKSQCISCHTNGFNKDIGSVNYVNVKTLLLGGQDVSAIGDQHCSFWGN